MDFGGSGPPEEEEADGREDHGDESGFEAVFLGRMDSEMA